MDRPKLTFLQVDKAVRVDQLFICESSPKKIDYPLITLLCFIIELSNPIHPNVWVM